MSVRRPAPHQDDPEALIEEAWRLTRRRRRRRAAAELALLAVLGHQIAVGRHPTLGTGQGSTVYFAVR